MAAFVVAGEWQAHLQGGVVVVAADTEKVVLAAKGYGRGTVRALVAHVTHENDRCSPGCVIRFFKKRLELIKASVNVAYDQHSLLELRRFHRDHWEWRLDGGERRHVVRDGFLRSIPAAIVIRSSF